MICHCQSINGYVETKAIEVSKFKPEYHLPTVDSGKKYLKAPATFDIETSKYNGISFMYIWQFAIGKFCIIGRTWNEYTKMINEIEDYYQLNEKCKLVVYVHNLSYEFQFIKNFIDIKNVFALDKRKILKISTEKTEYRCSYILSNMNLAKFLENTKNPYLLKSKEDLDFGVLRTPKTQLTKRELGYCYTDVVGLLNSINDLLLNDTLETIPLTSTGYVRRECRNAMRKNRKNRKNFLEKALTESQYKQCYYAFRGGNTASNRYWLNDILTEVGSWDISSSYPYVALLPEFPINKLMSINIDNEEMLNEYNENNCTIGSYLFKNLSLKTNIPIPYISVSKCGRIGKNENYNGRVLTAQFCEMEITNLDYEIIKNQYDFDELSIKNFQFSRKGKLPKELREEILHYFSLKCTLKKDTSKAYEYMKSKNRLNAIYGMMVTAVDREEYAYNSALYEVEEEESQELSLTLDKYYGSRNSFLTYQDGIFITALARTQLQKAIDQIGLDVVYCDTDSVKYVGDYDSVFKNLNNEILRYCKARGIRHSIEYDGETYYLGTWEKEETYHRFKTLGAKKYAYENENGQIGITIAGVPKVSGARELERKGGLKALKIGFVFSEIGKLSAEYIESGVHEIEINGEKIITGSCVNLNDTDYTVGITGTMLEIVENIRNSEKVIDF